MRRGETALAGLATLLSIFLIGCSDAGNPATGEVQGVVEQVVHGGAMPVDGEAPSRTISPVAGVVVTVTDETGETKMSMTTDMLGSFTGRLPVGTYTFSIPPFNETVPSSGKTSISVKVIADSLTTISLRYDLYAP